VSQLGSLVSAELAETDGVLVISPLAIDHAVRVLDGGKTIVGGDPPRALRLTEAGAVAARQLFAGAPPDTPALQTLARRLVAAGIAHPRPEPATVADVTVIVAVRDRPGELDRCLAATAPVPALVVDDGSRDAGAIGVVCRRHGAVLLRHEIARGPAAARNTGLCAVRTEFVAFLDSDCVPAPGWLAVLCGVLSDASVGAAAPRIRPLSGARGALARFAADRSPLDLGPYPAVVAPGGRVAYVPTAALLARRAALGDGFDPELRYGEDVDLVWRIHDRGWGVRYEPAATVGHAEPRRAGQMLRRRFAYGTAAGPLALRHPKRLTPLRLHPRPAAAVGLLLARRPGLAAVITAVHVAMTARSLRPVGVPFDAAAQLALREVPDSAVAIGRAATMLIPGLLAVGLSRRSSAPAALALLLAEPARSWARSGRELDPIRWSALAVSDDVAYGAGVWVGALHARTTAPLRPRLLRRGFPAGHSRQDRPGVSLRP
jgi:mycofactocin glycosyltransferase